jgi:plastocyanin
VRARGENLSSRRGDDGLMDGSGDSFELTLDEPGSYDYFCKFHPGDGMTGQIVVR